MKKKGLLLVIALFILSFTNLFSEEFADIGEDSFTDIGTSGGNQVKIEGALKVNNRKMANDSTRIESVPNLDLRLKTRIGETSMEALLNFKKGNTVNDIFKEGFMRLYYSNFDIDLGLTKVVWGKGDKLHVVDNINPFDYGDFINPDYLDRKIPEKMIKLNYYLGDSIIEAVYVPEFNPNVVPFTGAWAQYTAVDLKNALAAVGKDAGTVAQDVLGNYKGVDKSQAALRVTKTLAGFDLGASYYIGNIKNPSINKMAGVKLKTTKVLGSLATAMASITDAAINATNAAILAGLNAKFTAIKAMPNYLTIASNPTAMANAFVNDLNINYPKASIISGEMATVLFDFNLRNEIALTLTEDTDGTKVDIPNNKLSYLIGGDRTLPISNLNVNLQLMGDIKLNSDKIKANSVASFDTLGKPITENIDAEYDADEIYTNNLLVMSISDKYFNDKLKPTLKVLYTLERQDYLIRPEIEFSLTDEKKITLIYSMFGGKEKTSFGQFDKNDFVELNARFDF